MILTLYCVFAFPRFTTPHPQIKDDPAQTLLALLCAAVHGGGKTADLYGFAGFMMVEHFGLAVDQITGLYLINLMINMFAAPSLAGLSGFWGT